jgi:hypothetical protein
VLRRLKVEDLDEGAREGSVAAEVAPYIGVTPSPWGTTLGLLTSWDVALEFLPPTAGIWPHLAGQPTVGATPTAVAPRRHVLPL